MILNTYATDSPSVTGAAAVHHDDQAPDQTGSAAAWQTARVATEQDRSDSDNLVWIDLEMTGLDPSDHVILQAAIGITTADLEPIDELAHRRRTA
jgi:uncharacterized protein YprB with RNaseH-like and TPR domain